MYKHVSQKKYGYSWKGRLVTQNKKYLTVMVNALVFPVIDQDDPDLNPLGYGVLFDDVTEENRELIRGTFSSLLEASILKDNDTGKHIQRVNEYCRTVSNALLGDSRFPEVDVEFIENISFLAAMHDVGKIGIPDDILNKKGPLDDREWSMMQEHTINGAYILKAYPNSMAKDIALFHHEKWDGSGYPYKLPGNLIPLSARIVTIADVYDALRMKRSYKDGFSHEKACSIIKQNTGIHFDPRLVDYFLKLHLEFEKIYKNLADE